MKLTTASLLILFACSSSALRADLMPPPGPPGAVMKSLDQVEPRIPISALPFTIAEPGSYYLTGDLTGVEGESGIIIASDDVSIDLMGFTLHGVEGSLDGIGTHRVRHRNITIRNGAINGFGLSGIGFGPDGRYWVERAIIENIRASSNGVHGIAGGSGSVVRNCSANGNGRIGIYIGNGSLVESSSATANGARGIQIGHDGIVANCVAVSNQEVGILAGRSSNVRDCSVAWNQGGGISALQGSNVHNCTASRNGIFGISVAGGSIHQCTADINSGDGIIGPSGGRVSQCTASFNTGHGLRLHPALSTNLLDGAVIVDSTFHHNTGAGIHLPDYTSLAHPSIRIEGNHLTRNRVGLEVESSGNFIVRNSARGNTEGDYDIADGNEVGPIGTMAVVGHHPWANFTASEPASEPEHE